MLLGALAVSASAAAGSDTTRIAYEADAACPSPEQFIDLLRARTRSTVVWAGDGAVDLRVVLRRALGSSIGVVELNADGETVTRRLEAESCDEVAAAAALIAAVATGGYIGLTPPEIQNATPAPNATSPPNATPPPNAAPAPGPDAALPGRAIAPPRALQRWGAGAAATASAGVAPSMAFGGAGFVQVDLPDAPLGHVVVRASLGYMAAPRMDAEWGSASFSLAAARLEVCPFVLSVATFATVAGCLGATGGAIVARGQVDVAGGLSGGGKPLWWLDFTPAARAVLPAGNALWFEGTVGLTVPLRRYEFALETLGAVERRTRVYETPPAAIAFNAGIGIGF